MRKSARALFQVPTVISVSLLLVASGALVSAQRQMGTVVQDAPLLLLPERTRGPLLILERGVSVQVNRREGDWFNVTVEGSQWGERTGYVEARYLQIAPPEIPHVTAKSIPRVTSSPAAPPVTSKTVVPANTDPVAATGPQPEKAVVPPVPPKPVADVTLKGVRRIFIESMPGDLDQYISAEIAKDLKGRVVVVLDKANADAIMRGIGENKTGVGAAITGRYLGLHDNASASITLIDPNETVVLWASEAGDRSLMWGALARGGQRKVADRLVNNLKKALNEAR
jgi:hypothetical protein